MRKIFNVLLGKWDEDDRRIFFGPDFTPDAIWIENLPEDIMLHKLLATLGLVKSASEASNLGYRRPIPYGWTDMTFGKLNNEIYIFKGRETFAEFAKRPENQ